MWSTSNIWRATSGKKSLGSEVKWLFEKIWISTCNNHEDLGGVGKVDGHTKHALQQIPIQIESWFGGTLKKGNENAAMYSRDSCVFFCEAPTVYLKHRKQDLASKGTKIVENWWKFASKLKTKVCWNVAKFTCAHNPQNHFLKIWQIFFQQTGKLWQTFLRLEFFSQKEKPLPHITSEVSILNCSLLWSGDCFRGVICWLSVTFGSFQKHERKKNSVKCLFFCLHGICFFWWIVKFGLHNSQMKEKVFARDLSCIGTYTIAWKWECQSVWRW
jgi:hypothetical protein